MAADSWVECCYPGCTPTYCDECDGEGGRWGSPVGGRWGSPVGTSTSPSPSWRKKHQYAKWEKERALYDSNKREAARNSEAAQAEGLRLVGNRWHSIPPELMFQRMTGIGRRGGLEARSWAPDWALEIACGPGSVEEREAKIRARLAEERRTG